MPGKRKKRKKKNKNSKHTIKRRLTRFILLLAGGFVLFSALLVLAVYAGIFGQIPGEEEIKEIKQDNASLVLSREGKLLGKYFQVNRQSISNEDISAHVRHALIATEDNRFFEHKGIDPVSLARVFFKSLLMGDLDQGGGSTISQQLVKNLFPRKTFTLLSLPVNKVREMFIASRLEDVYSKEEILTLYLNTVTFGENVYGIEAASLRFYSKSAAKLNIDEAATLVGMLAANTAYNPRLHPERALRRRNVVLSRMHTQGFISGEQKEQLIEKPIELEYQLMDESRGMAPYFRQYIKARLIEILGSEKVLDTGGLRIYTTIDANIQKYAEDAMESQLRKLQDEFNQHWRGREPWEKHPKTLENAVSSSKIYRKLKRSGKTHQEIINIMSVPHKRNIYSHGGDQVMEINSIDSLKHYLQLLNSGFLALDPENGAILAWSGGANFRYLPYDHVISKRQTGSTFKPFVYATALMNGMDPCTYIANQQRVYEEYDDWSPGNTGDHYEGFYSLRGGLVYSMNTITAEVMINTGPEKVATLARQCGITSPLPEIPSLALGTADVSLLEMVGAYTAFANYGIPVKPFAVTRIENADGDTLYMHPDMEPMDRVFTEVIGQMMVNMMQGVVDSGTARSARSVYGIRSDLAGKTGTTQDNADGWFIGYTPGMVAGAWVGAEWPAIRFRTTALGSGSHMALPIVAKTIKQMESDPALRNTYLPEFTMVSDSLAAAMDCPLMSRDLPVEYLTRREARALKREVRDIKRKEENEERPNFFKRIRNFFRKKKK